MLLADFLDSAQIHRFQWTPWSAYYWTFSDRAFFDFLREDLKILTNKNNEYKTFAFFSRFHFANLCFIRGVRRALTMAVHL